MAAESNPQLVLCNGARLTSKKQAWSKAEPLELTSGKDGNVRIKLHEIVNQLTTNISARAADLLELAAFVYVADQAVKRAGKKEVDYGDKWHRNFRLEVAVREPDFWNQTDVREALIETLDFLTGDSFEFSFSKNPCPTPIPTFLDFAAADPNPEGVQRVLLFSGGLDSLAGAVEEMCEHKRRVALVSHKPVSHLASRQTGLVRELKKRAPTKKLTPLHVAVTANKIGQLDRDYTQRSRSFLYATLGGVVAELFKLDAIQFYENGIMSVNLPLAGHEVGARASRTTHPKCLVGFERILSLVFGRRIAVENEYLWLTKQDVVERLKQCDHAGLARHAVSCMHTRQTTHAQPHCAMCVQCLSRQLATLGAKYGANDPPSLYREHALLAPRKKTEDRTIAERFIGLAHEVETMTGAEEFAREFTFDLSRITPYVPGRKSDVVAKLFDLHRQHGEQVGAVVRAAMTDHVDDYYHNRLEETCALMMAFALGKSRPARKPGFRGSADEAAEFVPSENEWIVLRALDGAKQLMKQPDLEAATEDLGTRLSRRTIGPIMKKLQGQKLVEFPNGERSGARLTAAGKAFVNGNDPSH